jgi:predicted nuclease of predicted toxin-antitoxin system
VRFKLDENLPTQLADLLNSGGHDAMTVVEEGLSGESDSTLSSVCIAEGRTLVTLDLDFSNVLAYPPRSYPGLIVLRLHRQDKAHVVAKFQQIMELLGDEEIEGCLWIVEDHRIRVRT